MAYCTDSPKKKKKKTSILKSARECMIHIVDCCDPVSPFTDTSWKTARNASLIRMDNVFSSYIQKPNETRYGYHTKCYSSYTNKKSLSKFHVKDDVRQSNRSKENVRSTFTLDECILCRKNKTDPSGSGYEKTTRCVTENAANTIKQHSENMEDVELNVQLCCYSLSEIVAKGFSYHRSCFRLVSKKEKEFLNNSVSSEEYCNKIKDFADEIIFREGQVVKVLTLGKLYEKWQEENDIPLKGIESRKIKATLLKIYGHRIQFFQKKPGLPELVYSTDTGESKEHTQFSLSSINDKVKYVAQEIKNEIDNQTSCFSSWPPKEEELYSSNSIIPILLKTFLQTILTKSDEISERVSRLVKSIGEDIMYNATRGKYKTVKHIELGIFTKRKTGSKLLISCLNRLGHSISYPEVNYLETHYAELQMRQKKLRTYIPPFISANKFVTFVYDNCDHNAECINGEIMHCTNGIIIQENTDTIINTDDSNTSSIPTIKKRSFTACTIELEPFYQTKKKANPKPIQLEHDEEILLPYLSSKEDHLWLLARQASVNFSNTQTIPGWTGFYNEVSDEFAEKRHVVAYLPAIDKSPTKMETVKEILLQVKEKAEKLNLISSDLVLDHAIYCKALDIVSLPGNEDLQKFINLRMGGFHASCIFMAAIGKRFGSAGLKDLMIESNILGSNNVDACLRGKAYNKGIYALKTVFEGFQRMKFDAFFNWLATSGRQEIFTMFNESHELSLLIKKKDIRSLTAASNKFENLFLLLKEFEEKISEGMFGPMACFWMSFLEMVQLLLDYVKSIRMSNWDLHLYSMGKMLPWFHAYDHINYSRHFTFCWAEQKNLPNTHPEIYEEFKKGNFSIKRSNGKCNALPPDQVIEQTINKEQKGPGGIIGISTSVGTVQRWVLTSHITAALSSDFKASLGLNNDTTYVKDSGYKRQTHDETLVKSCFDLINQWGNPFEQSDTIIHLSSGVTASEDVASDLLKAKEIGSSSVETFIKSRVTSSEVQLNEPIKKKKLKTFNTLSTSKHLIKYNGSDMALKGDRQTFARLLLIQQQRGIDLRDVLKYELSPVPLSIANPDGSLCKTAKSKLLNVLEHDIPLCSSISDSIPRIFDAMVLIQMLPSTLQTFGEISDYLLKKVTKGSANTTYFVTDNYLKDSIKNMERSKRETSGNIRIKALRRDQMKPRQFKKYLSCSENKLDLIAFLLKDWSSHPENVQLIDQKKLYFTERDRAYVISVRNSNFILKHVYELSSIQEEADTKMFLCCLHALNDDIGKVCIKTVDTDVLALAIYYQSKLKISIYLEMGTGSQNRIYDISSNTLDEHVSEAILGFHAFTGCDTTSSFNGIGKIKAMKVLISDERFVDVMKLIGENNMNDTNIEIIEEYTCRLYGEKNVAKVNECRFNMFTKKVIPTPQRLPPTKDALLQHLKRVDYQVREWKQALEIEPTLQNPLECGWKIADGKLSIQWLTCLPAPDSILEFTSCNCVKRKCCSNSCSCFKFGLKCTPLCGCSQCDNVTVNDSDDESDNESLYGDSVMTDESDYEDQ